MIEDMFERRMVVHGTVIRPDNQELVVTRWIESGKLSRNRLTQEFEEIGLGRDLAFEAAGRMLQKLKAGGMIRYAGPGWAVATGWGFETSEVRT